MPVTQLTIGDVEKHLKLMLGDPLIDVELTTGPDNQLQEIVDHALRTYSRHRPKIHHSNFATVANQQKYDLTALGIDFGERVVDVRGPVTPIGVTSFDSTLLGLPGTIVPGAGVGRRLSDDLPDFLAREMELENLRRSTAANFDWDFRFEDVVNPSPPPATEQHGILYISPKPKAGDGIDFDFVVTPQLEFVQLNDQDWFLDYCLALAKLTLGHARRKWEDRLRMDGSNFVTEARDMIRDLTQEIKRRSVGRMHAPRQ